MRSIATLTSQLVNQQLPGDFNGDGVVDFADFFLFADQFGSSSPDLLYDLSGDGAVDFADFFLFADAFGGPDRAKLMDLAQQYLGLPTTAVLQANRPNPFNGDTVIPFVLPNNGLVEIAIYSLTGQKVKTLIRDTRDAGSYAANWDGKDDQCRALASGVYLCRLRVGEQQQTRKMVVVR